MAIAIACFLISKLVFGSRQDDQTRRQQLNTARNETQFTALCSGRESRDSNNISASNRTADISNLFFRTRIILTIKPNLDIMTILSNIIKNQFGSASTNTRDTSGDRNSD